MKMNDRYLVEKNPNQTAQITLCYDINIYVSILSFVSIGWSDYNQHTNNLEILKQKLIK